MMTVYFLAALAGSSATNASVLDIYREACIEGTLQLTPERGELEKSSKPRSDVFGFRDGPPGPDRTITISMKIPADTYVVIEQFDSPKAKLESVCRVTSRNWVEKDAQVAFIAGTTNAKVLDTRDGGHPYEPYIIDQPANGVRKKLLVHDPWVAVETGVYRETQGSAKGN